MLCASLTSRFNGLPRCSKPVQLSNGCGVMHLESRQFHMTVRGTYPVLRPGPFGEDHAEDLSKDASLDLEVSQRAPAKTEIIGCEESIHDNGLPFLLR